MEMYKEEKKLKEKRMMYKEKEEKEEKRQDKYHLGKIRPKKNKLLCCPHPTKI